MVDIFGISARGKAQQQGDLSKYATLDQLRNEIDDLLTITSVDPNDVVFFRQNKDD